MLSLIVNTSDPDQAGILSSFLSPGQGTKPDFVFNDIMLAVQHQPVKPSVTSTRPWDSDWLSSDTFQIAIGPRNAMPTSGTFSLGVQIAASITAASVANPTVITTSGAHNLANGNYVLISGSNSTPSIDGLWQVTVTNSTHFTIAANVTSAGTAGTIYDATGTNALAYNVAASDLQTALNAILAKQSLPQVSVSLLSAANYLVSGTSNGALTFYSPATNSLEPSSGVFVTQLSLGSSTSAAQSAIRLSQSYVADCEPSTALPAASISASVAQSGDSTHNKIYSVALTSGTYGGTFSLSVTTITPAVGTFGITASGNVSADELQNALVIATGLQTTDFNVTRTNDVLNIEFAGSQGHSNTPSLSASNIDLLAPQGVSGFLSLNTFALYTQFANTTANELTQTLSIRRTRATGEQSEYFLQDVILKRNLIGGALVPTPMASYYTKAQIDSKFSALNLGTMATQNANLVAITGGTISGVTESHTKRQWTDQMDGYTMGDYPISIYSQNGVNGTFNLPDAATFSGQTLTAKNLGPGAVLMIATSTPIGFTSPLNISTPDSVDFYSNGSAWMTL